MRILPTLLLLASFISFVNVNGQTSVNKDGIKKEDYSKIKGNPYLFKDWVTADLIHLEKDELKDVKIRYDLYLGELELMDTGQNTLKSNAIEINGEKFIILEDQFYKTIRIKKENNPKALKDFDLDEINLIKGFHKDFLNKYAVSLYAGEDILLIRTYDVVFRETKINSPGKIEKIKKFTKRTGYSIIKDREKIDIKLKDKDLYKALGKKDELKKYAKSNKLKLKKLKDVIKLLEYYETL